MKIYERYTQPLSLSGFFRACGIAALAILGISIESHSAQPLPPKVWNVDGFQVHQGDVSEARAESAMKSVRQQIGIVVSTDVPDDVLNFMRRVPIVLGPSMASLGNEGIYAQVSGRWVIVITSDPISSARPVLLHELLHAYHREVLGAAPEIQDAYMVALKSQALHGRYPDAHFLATSREFFAVIGSIYLFGRIQQPPYRCSSLPMEVTEFLAFLESRFGHHKCAS